MRDSSYNIILLYGLFSNREGAELLVNQVSIAADPYDSVQNKTVDLCSAYCPANSTIFSWIYPFGTVGRTRSSTISTTVSGRGAAYTKLPRGG